MPWNSNWIPSINLIFDPFPYPSNWLMRWTSPLNPIKVPLIHIMRATNPVTWFFCLAAFLWGDPKRAVAWWRTPLLRRGPWLGGWGLAGATRGRSCKKGTVPVFVLFIYIYWLVVWNIFPHIFVWGSCFWFCTSASPPLRRSDLSTHNLSTHNLSTHNLSTHNLSTHTLSTCKLSTHNLSTHNLSTHTTCPHTTVYTQLVHTQLVYTRLVYTQLVHTQLSTRNFNLSTHTLSTRKLSHNYLYTQLVHTQLAHTHNLYTHDLLTHTTSPQTTCSNTTCPHTTWQPSLCVAGVALGDMATSTLRGKRVLWWGAWFPVGAVDAAAVCVEGVALGDIERHFAWQAWHLATWTSTLRGKRGTSGTLRGRRGHLDFAWPAWHLVTSTSFVFPSFPVGMMTSHKACRKSWQNLRLHSAEHYIQTYMHTYYLFTHHLSLSRTVFHIQLCPTQLF